MNDFTHLLKKREAVTLQLVKATKEFHATHELLINACNVQKETMEYCLENVDAENDYKEAIEATQIQFGKLLTRRYYLMYNDAFRTATEMNELSINGHRLLKKIVELKYDKQLLSEENAELEVQIDDLDKTRKEFEAKSEVLIKEIARLKKKITEVERELQVGIDAYINSDEYKNKMKERDEKADDEARKKWWAEHKEKAAAKMNAQSSNTHS